MYTGVTDALRTPGADAVTLGRITGLFGVKGWVKVFSYTDPREAILDYDQWWLGQDGAWRAIGVRDGQRHGKSVIAHLDGADDRDQAETLVGLDIGVPRECLPQPEDGHYYWSDLEGLKVVHNDGTELGTVAYVMETGANDVLVTAGDKERLIPFVVDEIVLGVDLANGVINVNWEWD